MILFSGKHANRLMNPEDLKHSYGYILAKSESTNIIDVIKFLPKKEGTKKEIHLDKVSISQSSDCENLQLCGFFHGFPRSIGGISEMDLRNLSSFGLNAICIVFDFTKVNQYNNGFLVYQLEEGYAKNTPYTITHPEAQDKYYFARSLVNLSEKYEFSGNITPENVELLNKLEYIPTVRVSEDKLEPNEIDPRFLVEIPEPNLEDYELSLIDQDFEVQKLRQDIEKASKDGKSSAYLKLQLANRLISHMANDSEILRYLESAEEEFKAREDSESRIGLAITKNELGLFYEERGNYYAALTYFDDSHSILKEQNEYERGLKVLNNIGNIYYKLNNFDTALKTYYEAYNLSQNLVDKVLVFNNIADVYLKLRNYERAFSILVKNAEFFQETQNDYGLSFVFSKLAKLYFEQGNKYFHLAKKYCHLALAIKRRNHFHQECIDDYELLSVIYLREKAYRVAEDNLIQGLNLVRTLGFTQREGFFLENMGNLFLLEEKFVDSIEYFKLAKESYEQFSEKEAEGQMLEQIGEIYLEHQQDLSKSLEFYEQSLEAYKEGNFRRKLADILVKIAELHLDMNEPISAVENLQKARKLYKSMYDDTTANIISERIRSLEI
jgi:tetratricopeptide (TPR) repeat protein